MNLINLGPEADARQRRPSITVHPLLGEFGQVLDVIRGGSRVLYHKLLQIECRMYDFRDVKLRRIVRLEAFFVCE